MVKESDIETNYKLGTYEYSGINAIMGASLPTDDSICLYVLETMESLLRLIHGPSGSRKTTRQKQDILALKNAVLLAIKQNRPDLIKGTFVNVGTVVRVTCIRCISGRTSLEALCKECGGSGVYAKVIEPSITIRLSVPNTEKDFLWTFPQGVASRILEKDTATWRSNFSVETHSTAVVAESVQETQDAKFVLWFLYRIALRDR